MTSSEWDDNKLHNKHQQTSFGGNIELRGQRLKYVWAVVEERIFCRHRYLIVYCLLSYNDVLYTVLLHNMLLCDVLYNVSRCTDLLYSVVLYTMLAFVWLWFYTESLQNL